MPALITITCRLAVAGHTYYSLTHDPAEEAASRARVTVLMDAVLAAVRQGAQAAIQACYGYEPALVDALPRMILQTCLAPGTDQLAAERAGLAEYELAAILPSTVENYAAVIPPDAAAVIRASAIEARRTALVELDEVLPVEATDAAEEVRQKAYKIAGHVVLQNADFLLAIFDDDKQRPVKSAGTAEMVRRAHETGIPTMVIHPGLGTVQVSTHKDRMFDATTLPEMQAVIADGVRRELTLIPDPVVAGAHEEPREVAERERQRQKEIQRLKRYFDEQPLRDRRWFWKMLVQGRTKLDGLFSVPKEKFFEPEASVLPVEMVLGKFRDEADMLSIHYTGLHRASVTLLFTFGVLAVLFAGLPAVMDAATGGGKGEHGGTAPLGISWTVLCCAAELFCLIAGVWLFVMNKLGGWQERATDYRLLAERLRHAAALSVLGRATWQYAYEPLPAHYSEHNPRFGWVDRMFRALVRQAVLPIGTRNLAAGDYLAASRRHLVGSYLGVQIEYHRRNAAKLHREHLVVEVLSYTALALTFAACIAHFFWHCPLLTLCATTFPAVIAACHGLAAHFHLQRVLARSEAMERRLEQQLSKLETIHAGESSQAFAVWVEETADLMLQEADDWRVVFRLLNVPTPG